MLPFTHELRVLIITLICFEVSYLVRFIFDTFLLSRTTMDPFVRCTLWSVICFTDGVPYIALLAYHYKNFRI